MTTLQDALMAAAISRVAQGGTPLGHHRTSVAVVVEDLVPAAFISGVIRFTLGVPEAVGAAWLAGFTPTVFLAGRPASVRSRHCAAYATADGALAWYGPDRDTALRVISRLLRAFHGPAPVRPPAGVLTIQVPGIPSGRTAEARIATGGVGAGDYLVHVHHLFAEATLRGLVRPGDTVRVEHHEQLGTAGDLAGLDPAEAGRVQNRISHDTRESARLRLFGVLRSDGGGNKTCKPNAS